MIQQRGRLLRWIAVFKLIKAAILIAVAIGAFNLIGADVEAEIRRWSHALHLHGRYVDEAIARLGGLDAHDLARLGVGTLVYAGVFIAEGVGLWLRQLWAEYVTVIVSTSFIPFEIYETIMRLTATRVAMIALNVAVVAYLILRLRKDRHWPFRSRTPARP